MVCMVSLEFRPDRFETDLHHDAVKAERGTFCQFDANIKDDTAKGGLTQFKEFFTMTPFAPKDFKL